MPHLHSCSQTTRFDSEHTFHRERAAAITTVLLPGTQYYPVGAHMETLYQSKALFSLRKRVIGRVGAMILSDFIYATLRTRTRSSGWIQVCFPLKEREPSETIGKGPMRPKRTQGRING